MATRSNSQARTPLPCEQAGGQQKKQDAGVPGTKLGKKVGGSASSSFPNGGRKKWDGPSNQFNNFRGRGGGKKGGVHRSGCTPPSLNREDELGSLYNPGSKKQNISHLLNFQFATRGGNGNSRSKEGGRRTRHTQPTPHYSSPKPKYDTRQYLQANCQFIVRAGVDYFPHTQDPDILVDWDLIEQLILKQSGSEPTACPICLFPPTAAKISRCGHVFCWPCILHYLALSDDQQRKCPICEQFIARQDLRSVLVLPQKNLSTGSVVQMRLMKRDRESLIPVPLDSGDTFIDFPTVQQAGSNRRFIKMFQASAEEVRTNIISREKNELDQQWKEEHDQPESCFIQEALTLLASRLEFGLMEGNPTKSPTISMKEELPKLEQLSLIGGDSQVDPFKDDDSEETVIKKQEAVEEIERPRYMSGESISSEGEVEDTGSAVCVEDLDISILQGGAKEVQEKRSTFYFYQSSDGQPVFLHALNVQMLVTQFGSLENCPKTIEAEILEKDSSSMTSELRDRLRYLRHLPVSSSFEVAELDLSKIVSETTLSVHKSQLEERRKKRKFKLREERRREKRIHLEEKRLMGRFPSPMARIESEYHYPGVGQEHVVEHPEFPIVASEDDSASIDGIDVVGTAFSFANAAKYRPAQSLEPAIPQSISNPGSGWTVLGPKMALPMRRVRAHSDSEPEPEGYTAQPPLPTSLGDALAAALAAAPVTGASGGRKKGKRGKAVVLNAGPPRPVL